MGKVKQVRKENDPEQFAEDEHPWRPTDNDLDPEPIEGSHRISQDGPLEPETNAVDETLEDVLGEDSESEPSESNDLNDDLADETSQETQTSEEENALEESAEQPNIEISSSSVAEAVLFSGDEPVTPNKLADIVGVGGVKEIREIVEELNAKYESMGCAFRIESIAGGFLMLTLPEYNIWLRKLIKVRGETKLSPAALETLAIIAYKQPVMRVDIESIRGVAAGEMVRQLIDKGLVKIVGRAEELGRPLLYGTTRKFLETFGLGNLKDLPSAEDLKKPL